MELKLNAVEAQVLSIKNRVNKWNNTPELGVTFDLSEPHETVKRLWVALDTKLVTWEKGDVVLITGEISKVIITGDLAFLSKKSLTIRSTDENGEAVKMLGELAILLGGDQNNMLGDFEISKLTLAQLRTFRQIVTVAHSVGKATAKPQDTSDDILGIDDILEAEGVV